MKRLYSIIKPFERGFWGLVLYSLILNIFTLSNPLVLKFIFDEGIKGKNLRLFILLVSIFIFVSIFWRVLNYHYSLLLEKFKIRVTKYWLKNTINAFLKRPYKEIITKDSGYYLSRIYEEPESLSNELVSGAIDAINLGIGLILSLALLLYFSVYATLILFLIIPVTYFLSSYFSQKIKEYTDKERESEAKLRETITDVIRSVKFIKSFQFHDFIVGKFIDRLSKFLSIYLKNFEYATGFDTLSSIFLSLSELSVIIVSGYLMIIDKMTFGSFMGFMNTFWGFIGAVQRFIGIIPEIAGAMAIYDRLENFINVQNGRAVQFGEKIILKNVSFSYDGKSRVLDNFSLIINPGEKILILGENGSGKTTLANIISGLIIPEGQVTLLKKVSLMPDNLPSLRLREYAVLDERNKFFELIKLFQLEDYLDKTPGELSMGQRKKFTITLTLIRDADIYIFDEPLVNLDSLSKNLAMDLIFENTYRKTLIIISHNSIKNRFDRVIKLERR